MKRLMLCSAPLLLLLGAIFTVGCGDSGSSSPTTQSAGARKYPYIAVTTVGMVTDIVKQVAGDKANVRGIIGEGVDPHLYKPTRNDVSALLEGDVIFYSGLMLEGKMTDTFVKVATSGKPVYAVTQLIDSKFLLEPPEFAGHPDPHVWMSVPGWMKAVEAVAESLSQFDPPNANYYDANAQRYLAELKKLDEYAHASIGSVPRASRILITAHDAFNYFGREYDIDVQGIQGISTESEAGLQQINRLVNDIVTKKIQAVFTETSVSDKNIRALIDGAAAQGAKVKDGGKLFSDAMGAPGTYEGTYIGMIDHNVTTISRALGGNAPEKGMNGKLK
ncbi:MAG: manganese/zinc/iron transport system substrate-binding protein [Humisphaera sp.]|nr:manganese/zinc/iron transport system substrate-binding protein [Humisphaera sp.]